MSKEFKVFVASSNDLEDERKALALLLYEEGFIPILWENIDHSITKNEFQDRINNEYLTKSDIVILMVRAKLGDYTIEEFKVAYENLGTKIQKMYVYFISTSTNGMLIDVMIKIDNLKKFLSEKEKKLYREVENYQGLENHFLKQIKYIKGDIVSNTPLGVEEIRENKNEKLKYKRYLSNDELPYISRSRFKKEKLLENSLFQTEDEFYNSILSSNAEFEGIFISGEGGVGKTRLMYELGRRAQREGWVTYQILYTFQGWDTLKLDHSKKYCFLFDYIEENNYFDNNIFELLEQKYPNVSIKIIANARNTYLLNNEVNESLFNIIDLDIKLNDEHSYLKYVILEIFKSKDIELDEEKIVALEKYINKPSFAIFLLHGILKDKTLDFHDISEFSTFIKKRLRLTFQKENFLDIESNIFHLLFCLPIKLEKISEIMDELIIAPLVHDGWIEYDREYDVYKSLYNDTIMDEILISYLNKKTFKREQILEKELKSMFDFSIKYSSYLYTFRALDRVSKKSIISDKELLLMNIFRDYIDSISDMKNIFIKSSLLSSSNKIKFFNDTKIIEDKALIYAMTLSNAIKTTNVDDYNSEYIKGISIIWVNNHSDHLYFDFVTKEYLLKNEDIIQVEDAIVEWINNKDNANHLSFTYMFARYLEKKGNITKVEDVIVEWIKNKDNANHPSFTYILSPYLEKKDDIAQVEDVIVEWIKNKDNANHPSFTYILSLYLEKKDDIAQVEDVIVEWIKNKDNANHPRFTFIAVPYLKKNGDIMQIESAIAEWINNKDNASHPSFTFIADPYLRKNCNLEKVELAIVYWLKNNQEHESISHILRAYLRRCNSINNIQNIVVEWINNKDNASHPNFTFIADPYLKKNGDIMQIESAIAEWINNKDNASHPSFTFIADPYLKKNCNLEKVELAIVNWLKNNLEHESFTYVLIPYLIGGGNFVFIENSLKEYINNKTERVKKLKWLLKKNESQGNNLKTLELFLESITTKDVG
jgi:hypothetical protein